MSYKNIISSPLHVRPQPKLTVTKSELTRTKILNAALDFLWTHPFRDMTVSSLMAATGVSRSAFYQYFKDVRVVMKALLDISQEEIFATSNPWLKGIGDPVALLREALSGLVHLCYNRGPIFKAVADAATTDERFEKAWRQFLGGFDDAACVRIEADQAQGLIPKFDARPVAIALNRLDAYTVIQAFGQHPRSQPEPVLAALVRIWMSTLYGSEWLGKDSSTLVRT
jgi:TetR/AcrR family transcriptional regulator, ethionamide resistance regulator